MVEELGSEGLDTPDGDVISVPDLLTDLAGEMAIPGLPAPVRRNLLKSLGRLSSALVDAPIALLEGKANEWRTTSSQRVNILNRTGDQIAQQIEIDPEYARRAAQMSAQRLIGEQMVLDNIAQKTASDIWDAVNSGELRSDESIGTVNDDWLNTFVAEGKLKSTEEAQALFARILAGEIRRPGSYSTKTIRILGSLDPDIANHFMALCSICISTQPDDIRVPSLGGHAGTNALRDYGLNFGTLNLLNEYGLIISEYHSWREFKPCMTLPNVNESAICIPFSYAKQRWALEPVSSAAINKTLKIYGVALTHSGRELFRIVDAKPVDEYTQSLRKFFKKEGFEMVQANLGNLPVVDVAALRRKESQ